MNNKPAREVLLGKELPVELSGPAMQDTIAKLARTEDCRFSPDGNSLVVAGFAESEISRFFYQINQAGSGLSVSLNSVEPIRHESFDYPHGIDFLNDTTISVANRGGNLSFFQLAATTSGTNSATNAYLGSITRADRLHKLHSPGSVAIDRQNDGSALIYVCNNYRNRVSVHRVADDDGLKFHENRIILSKDLKVPDGIALNSAHNIMAVSNHHSHEVFLYHLDDLSPKKEPFARLAGLDYAHGLRFTKDGKTLVVADAGAPFIHIFHNPNRNWCGKVMPSRSVRIMDDETFFKGRFNLEEGGPKGVDIDPSERVLLTTSEFKPFAFFDFQAMLAGL